MGKKNLAEEYIKLTDLWEKTDKNIVLDNLEYHFGYTNKFKGAKTDIRKKTLMEITDSKSYAVLSWFNRSRTTVKIPLYKLCKIANYLDVDIYSLLSKNNESNKDWDTVPGLSQRQRELFKNLNECKYYNNGSWDIKLLVEDISTLENYDDENKDKQDAQLKNDCSAFIESVLGVKSSLVTNEIDNFI